MFSVASSFSVGFPTVGEWHGRWHPVTNDDTLHDDPTPVVAAVLKGPPDPWLEISAPALLDAEAHASLTCSFSDASFCSC